MKRKTCIFRVRVDWTVTLCWVVQYNVHIFIFCILSCHIASHPEVSQHLKRMYVNVTFSCHGTDAD